MYTKMVDEHIKRMKRRVDEKSILVYRGFHNSFLLELAKFFPFVTNQNELFLDGKIDLRFIKDRALILASTIQQLAAGPKLILYEEFIVLQKSISLELLGRKFIVVVNDLFSEFPNQSTEGFIDVQEKIDHDERFEENELFTFFYADSFDLTGKHYVQYQDIDTSDKRRVAKMNFFTPDDYQAVVLHRCPATDLPDQYIVLNASENAYRSLKDRVFEGSQDEDVRIVIDVVSESTPAVMKELAILNHLFVANGFQLTGYVKTDQFSEAFREDFTSILSKYWKSNTFRLLEFYSNPNIGNAKALLSQGAIIEEIVKQVEQAASGQPYTDIFLTAPTGAGKSVLFQIPAIYLAQRYSMVTICVSPLKALMFDQVRALKEKGIDEVAFINSDVSLIQRDATIKKLKDGSISILYLSPELLLSYDISTFIGERRIGLFVIDEAHLVTTWGRDFRVDYWYLGVYLRKLRKTSRHTLKTYSFPVLALTATAVYNGPNDMVFQTISSLNMLVPKLFIGNARRDEISFDIRPFGVESTHEAEKIEKTRQEVERAVNNSVKAIAYFPWTNQVRHLYELVAPKLKDKVGIYFGGVDKEERREVLEKFKTSEIMLVLATKAFGMGVDISDITLIYHHAPSGNLSDYVQEIGRVARDKELKGIARTDFNPKDLKFTKVLYGLSSIKQFQVRLVLEKVNEIYRLHRSANFLVSIEDFGFVFNLSEKDLEQKVKSALLVLEKDLIAKYGYNVLVVRPKSLYSTVFAKVARTHEQSFVARYSRFVKKVDFEKPQIQVPIRNGIKTISSNPGPYYVFYEIELDKVWEQHFQEYSFPYIKKQFFDKTLFVGFEDAVIPQYKIRLSLKEPISPTHTQLISILEGIESALHKLRGHYFSKHDLEEKLNTRIKNKGLRRRVIDLMMTLYASNEIESGTFLQLKRQNDEDLMRVIDFAYQKVRSDLEQKLYELFTDPSELNYENFIPTDSEKIRHLIKFAYTMESLSLGTYEIVGGKLPQIFIRVNDPFKLNMLTRSQYENDILVDIEKRHRDSMRTMDYFFQREMDDACRWDFIESYFLGHPVDFETINDN